MNQLQEFHNNNFGDVGVLKKEKEVWFVAKDICDALNLSDVSMSLQRLDEDEKLKQTLFVSGQNREIWLINEPGMYSLVLKSRKPEAKKFKRWITHDVIPEIRKTGSYNSQPQIDGKQFALESTKMLMPLMEELKLSAASKMTAVKKLYEEAGIQLPFHVQLPDNLLTCTEIAKKIGVYSNSGNPHSQAVGAIINEINIHPNEVETTLGSNEKHQYSQQQYYPPVLKRVRAWLTIKGKPSRVETERGNYNVKYLSEGSD